MTTARKDKAYIQKLLADAKGLNGVGITSNGVKVNIVDPNTEPRRIIIELDIMPEMPQAY